MAKMPPPDLLKALKAAREQSEGSLPSHATRQPKKPLTPKADGLTLEALAKAFAKTKNFPKLH
jgi:hypothetical protein